MSFFVFKVNFFWLGVNKGSYYLTVADNSVISKVSIFFGVVSLVFFKTFLFGFVPIFIESSFNGFVKGLSPNSCKSSKTSWGFYITDKTNNFHWWSFNNGNGFITFFIIDLRSWSLDMSDYMCHTGFPSHKSGKVAWFGGIISWERSDLTSMLSCSFSRKKS